MKIVHDKCAGIDVHKKNVVVCALLSSDSGLQTTIRTFPTTTESLLSLADWLTQLGVTQVAMESTGVYWKPVWNILELTELKLMLVNAHHIKQVPGRKTDVKDAQWIAQLLRHGLLQASFIPDRPQRELRELVRYRRSLIEMRTSEVQRIQKVLEGANIKLGNVVSDIMGRSGTAMLKAIVDGVTDPAVIASKAHHRLRATPDELEAALRGGVNQHQRLMLKALLQHIEHIDGQIKGIDEEVEQRTLPFAGKVADVDSIPGFALRASQDVLAEIGFDMSAFSSANKLTSWACVCPGINESGGKNNSSRTRRGNRWLRAVLNEAALGAIRKKDCYFGELYRRIKARRGSKRAIMALCRTLLEIIWHLLKRGTTYQELGPNYLDNLERQQILNRSVKRLEKLGFDVVLAPKAA